MDVGVHAAGGEDFAIGFIMATAVLHVVGIGIGLALGRFGGKVLARVAGAATALGGLWLAFGA